MKVIKPEAHHVFAWVELAKEFYAEGHESLGWGFNETDLHRVYHSWIGNQPGYLLEHEGKIIGVLAGIVNYHFFNLNDPFFHESMWYISPPYRRKGGGALLLKACFDDLKKQGIKRVVFCHTTAVMPEKFERMYKRMGFKKQEVHYVKEIA